MNSDLLLNNNGAAAIIADSEVPVISPEKQFLHLALEVKTPVLLSVLHLVEILTISVSQVVPMFEMPAWVAGVYNWRGDILWIVDLNHLIGLLPWHQQANYISKHTVVVVRRQSEGNRSTDQEPVLGLVVNRVNNMVVCEPESFLSVDNLEIPKTIKPFLKGYRVVEDGTPEWILNGDSILGAMPG